MYIPDMVRKEMLRRGYSIRTIKAYKQCIKIFFNYCKKEPKKVNKTDIIDFLDRLKSKGASGSTLNVYLSALRFMYMDVLKKRLMIYMKFSRKPKKLPIVLTKDEVKSLISVIENPTHALLVKLMYSAGLRISEVVKLRPVDLEYSKNYGWVRMGKGNRDRLFIIAKKLKKELREHILTNCHDKNSWIFKGYKDHISISYIQKLIKIASKKAKIKKNVSAHTLRHSFSTHLLEDDYDLTQIQSLLGHASASTTMTYLHMTNNRMIKVKSPYDKL